MEKTAQTVIPKTARVLDFGCGYGFYFRINPRAHGVDGDPNSVKFVNDKYGDGRAQLLNLLEELPFQDASYDWILAHDVFEHFEYPELVKILKEMARILEDQGKIVVWVPNEKGFHYSMNSGHKLLIDNKIIEQLCSDSDFEIETNYSEPLPRRIGSRFVHNKEVFILVRKFVVETKIRTYGIN
jgi:SAM-dependent methyltransferase